MILSGTTSSPEVLCGRLEPIGSLEGMLTIPTIETGGGGGADVKVEEIPNEAGGITVNIQVEVYQNGSE